MFRRRRSTHAILRRTVEQRGLDGRELGAQAQVDPDRVADALKSDIDLEANLSVAEVKRVLAVLDVDFLTLFDIRCAFCDAADEGGDQRGAELGSLPRNTLIAKRREKLGLSLDELLGKLGITAWFARNSERPWAQNRMRLWRAIEERPDSIDDLSLDQVRLLNKVLLLPLQLLLGVRCRGCGA